MTSSGPLVIKLREGLQEAVVFLRTLAAYKIPAVIERRRQELFDKLCLLQGDTIKGVVPVIEPPKEDTPPSEKKPTAQPSKGKDEKKPTAQPSKGKDEKKPTAQPSKGKDEKKPTAKGKDEKKPTAQPSKGKDSKVKDKSPVPSKEEEKGESSASNSSSTVTSPSHGSIKRRDSKIVNSLISNFETIHSAAKREEEDETPKRFVVLKKVAKPTDFPSSPKHSEEGEGEGGDAVEEKKDEDDKLSSIVVDAAAEEDEEGDEEAEKKKKGKRGFNVGLKVKGLIKREKSPILERKSPAPSAQELVDSDQEDVGEETPSEDGVKICGVLERRHKKGIGHKWVKVEVKVKEKVLIIGGKENIDLAGSSVEGTDSGFEFSTPHHKPLMFKVDGSDEERQKWITILKEAIEEATPPEEEKEKEDSPDPPPPPTPQESIPSITINEVPSQQEKKTNKRDSKTLTTKPEKKLPDQGVATKGYIHRKKPGLTRNWEKAYCVLTYQAMYFTTVEDNKEYSNMLPISQDCQGKLSETKKGKGHDKHCQVPGLALKIGKKVEQFSFDSQTEFGEWKDAIEKVLGIGGVEELLSEDEEREESVGPEDLYEELETDYVPPPVPSSPRPTRSEIPKDDFYIDEDIYEDTDDILPTMPAPPSPSHAPSLPDRNPPKKLASPPPNLPPRSAAPNPSSGPSLPPRNAPSKSTVPTPQDYE